jgi:uncharacterized protein (TIGR03435 family)
MMNVIRASVVVFAAAASGVAQAPPAPAFEVASVKPNPESGPPGDIPSNMYNSPGHFIARDRPLRYFIEWAYDLKDYQVVGPKWIEIDNRYDITAHAPGPATNDQMRPMLQMLLSERFQMKSHFEKRDLQVYALLPGKGAPKLTKAEASESPRLGGGGKGVEFHNFPLSRLTFLLTRRMDRPVLDLTGITGNFDFNLDLSGLGNQPGSSGFDGDGPSVFQAVQEDLGLKLEPRKSPVDVLVVDSVNKVPSGN